MSRFPFFGECGFVSRFRSRVESPESRRENLMKSILSVLGGPNNSTVHHKWTSHPPNSKSCEKRHAKRQGGISSSACSTCHGASSKARNTSSTKESAWCWGYIKRLAQDDARLLAWEERRQLERQRRQNRTWWQWLPLASRRQPVCASHHVRCTHMVSSLDGLQQRRHERIRASPNWCAFPHRMLEAGKEPNEPSE